MQELLKDEKLFEIVSSNRGNVAQFISVAPDDCAQVKLAVIDSCGHQTFKSVEDALLLLLDSSRSKKVNIRSFTRESPKGHSLHYGKGRSDIEEILNIIKENALKGKYSIINENIDVSDGGISGVVLGNIVEFSPDDTPKCVEKEGVCRLSKSLAYSLFNTVYGFTPNINFPRDHRVEFSIHPKMEGARKEHTVIWEYERCTTYSYDEKISWPNNFSRFIGDKVFGLLVADCLGLNVPYATVISRRIAPFSFGKRTGLHEKWLRTCPIIKEPGKYQTSNMWVDPFFLVANEEKKGNKNINIASIISQDSVKAEYSGACIIGEDKRRDIIEGVAGAGDGFMMGVDSCGGLPEYILNKVAEVNAKIRSYAHILGDRVSFEWVYDGERVWVVQLNQLQENTSFDECVIVDGVVESFVDFDTKKGLEALRSLIKDVKNRNIGVRLIGKVGITSHLGDLLRQGNIPSRIVNQ